MLDQPFETIFLRAVLGEIDSAKAGLWSTFIKPTRFTVYKEQIPDPSNSFNQYISAATDFHVTNQMEMSSLCQKYHCAAVAMSTTGTLILFSHLSIGSFISKPGWKTMVNMSPLNFTETLKPYSIAQDIDTCCRVTHTFHKPVPPNERPVHKFVHEVPRISCNLSREEFVEEVVRKRKAVILSGCQSQYQWLDDMDLSLE